MCNLINIHTYIPGTYILDYNSTLDMENKMYQYTTRTYLTLHVQLLPVYRQSTTDEMDAAAELGRNPVSKHQIRPEYGDDEHADAGGDCRTSLARPKLSGANGDRGISILPV